MVVFIACYVGLCGGFRDFIVAVLGVGTGRFECRGFFGFNSCFYVIFVFVSFFWVILSKK